jgi:O-antigen ligase
MRVLRFGICALVVFGILAHGAVEDWARAVLETGAALLFLYWALRAARSATNSESSLSLVLSPLLLPLLALVLVVTAQLLFRATASSYHTRVELQLLVSYILVLFLVEQAFRRSDHWRTLVWFLMCLGFVVSIFAILQHLTFNGKLYWFREMRYGGIPFGPYVNRNHFAGFAELIIPVALVPLVLGKVRRERWVIVGILALIPIGALFLSASRGGIVSFAVEVSVLVLLMLLRRSVGKHILAGAVVMLLAFVLVSWLGVHQILERFSSMQSLEASTSKRASMRQDTWHIFRDHPVIGTGLGTLQIVYPPYESLYDGKIVNHAHNDYLEALAETGIAGGLCCAWFLALLFYHSLRQLLPSNTSFAAALRLSGLVACCGFLTHSLVDFNLHIPGNALLFFLSAHLAAGGIRAQAPNNSATSRSKLNH